MSDPKAAKKAAIDKLFAPPPPLDAPANHARLQASLDQLQPDPDAEVFLALEPRARVLALKEARQVLAAQLPFGTLAVNPIQLVQVAQYILTGQLAITPADLPEVGSWDNTNGDPQ